MPSSPPSPPRPDVVVLRDLAAQIAIDAGRLLMAALDDDRTDVGTKSTGTDMVTEMDRASERFLVERITERRPHDAILGEEGADRDGTSGVRWIIDPLDGTTNYLYRLPGWNVSVGVEFDGVPVAGAVVGAHARRVVRGRSGARGDLQRPATPARRARTAGDRPRGHRLRLRPDDPCTTGPCTGRAPAPGARHPPGGRSGRRPLRPGGRAARRLRRERARAVGSVCRHGDRPRGRRPGRGRSTTGPLPGELTVAAHPDRWDELAVLLHEVGLLR